MHCHTGRNNEPEGLPPRWSFRQCERARVRCWSQEFARCYRDAGRHHMSRNARPLCPSVPGGLHPQTDTQLAGLLIGSRLLRPSLGWMGARPRNPYFNKCPVVTVEAGPHGGTPLFSFWTSFSVSEPALSRAGAGRGGPGQSRGHGAMSDSRPDASDKSLACASVSVPVVKRGEGGAATERGRASLHKSGAGILILQTGGPQRTAVPARVRLAPATAGQSCARC